MRKKKQSGKKTAEDEQELPASEATYHTLFDSIDEGFVVAELLFDEAGTPVDLVVLETNASFDRMMQTTEAVGKRSLEIFPEAEASWFEAYGRVVETGKSLRFENYLATLDKWFDLYISRVGEADSHILVIVFNEITERKKAEQELKRTKELLQATLDSSLEDIQLFKAVRDENGSIVDFVWVFTNKTWNDKWGSMAGKRLLMENPGVLETGLFDTFVRVTESGVAMMHELNYTHEQFNGWFLQSLAKVEDGFLITAVEITERKLAEEKLRLSEERLRLIIESAKGYAIFTTDTDGIINSWNPGAAHIFGWSEAEILGQNAAVLFTPEDRATGEPQKELETAKAHGIAPDIRWHQRKDGSRVFIHGEVRPLRDGQRNGFVKIGRDLTAQRHAEEVLLENQKQLQVLNETLEQQVQEKTSEVRKVASELIEATQQERHRISHLLHDDLQQSIYAIKMQIAFLGTMLKDGQEAAHRELLEIADQLNEILEMTRQLSIDLSPPILRDEGLWHAIHWLADRMQQRYGIPIDLQAEGTFVIPGEELQVLLFNCVRELLFNVVKHAQASQAVVTLDWMKEHTLRIEVRDNGKGFPVNTVEDSTGKQDGMPKSLGLPTIRHQLALFGGSLEIHSAPGAGTQVVILIPIAGTSQ